MGHGQQWLAIVADASGATLQALRAEHACVVLVARRHVDYESAGVKSPDTLAEVRDFVREHELGGASAVIHLMGTGTVVQRLSLPPMSTGRRNAAIQTRLTTYAAGRPLCVDQHLLPGDGDGVQVLAAGADAELVRDLLTMLKAAGVHVRAARALTASVCAPRHDGRVVQLVLGQRSSMIQLFENGQLVFCRDVLVGRADFVTAYQRPIITESGPRTLSKEEAESLVRKTGIPISPDQPIENDIRANHLWPLVTPVLQRLRSEVSQTLEKNGRESWLDAQFNALSLPSVPGLGEHLAAELSMSGPVTPPEDEESTLASALVDSHPAIPIDLLPPEVRFVQRMRRPTIAAAVCAGLIMLGNSGIPRDAQAEVARVEPAKTSLEAQCKRVEVELDDLRVEHARLAGELSNRTRLTRAMPPAIPTVAVSRMVFGTLPPGVQIEDMTIDGHATPAEVELTARYQGVEPAGAVAADWSRRLKTLSAFRRAELMSIQGDGNPNPATIEIRMVLE